MEIFFVLILCLVIFGGLAVAIIGFGIALYNSIVKLKVLVDEGWSSIDVQLKKRYDLIPNLVETVKGYAKHEKGTFEQVTKLRSSMMSSESPAELAKYEGELRGALKSLFAVSENYPELKANENFLGLQSSLQEIEDDIEKARRYYNGTVRNFNIKIVTFPNNLLAGYLGYQQMEFFETTEGERANVEVKF